MKKEEMLQDSEKSARMTVIVTISLTVLLYLIDHIAQEEKEA